MSGMNLQAMQALLNSQSMAAKPLLEFKAGMLNLEGTSVTPDPRRGKITLITTDDGLLHLQWTQRPGGGQPDPINDIILFPGDSWARVSECNTGRVYVLRVSNGRKRLFWMQEEKDDKDEEIAKTLNDLINKPREPAELGGDVDMVGDGGAGAGAGPMDQDSFMRFLEAHGVQRPAASPTTTLSTLASAPPTSSSTARPATGAAAASSSAPAPTSSASTSSSRPSAPPSSSASSSQAATIAALSQQLQRMVQAQGAQQMSAPTLGPILEPERLGPLLNDDKMLEALYPYLPEGQRTPQAVREQLRSPQFQQTLARMSSVLNGPQYSAVMTSLGLPVGSDFGVLAFLKAIQDRADTETKQQSSSSSSSSSTTTTAPSSGSNNSNSDNNSRGGGSTGSGSSSSSTSATPSASKK